MEINTRHKRKVFAVILRTNSETLSSLCHFFSCFLTEIIDRISKDKTLTSQGFSTLSAHTQTHMHTYICLFEAICDLASGKTIANLGCNNQLLDATTMNLTVEP